MRPAQKDRVTATLAAEGPEARADPEVPEARADPEEMVPDRTVPGIGDRAGRPMIRIRIDPSAPTGRRNRDVPARTNSPLLSCVCPQPCCAQPAHSIDENRRRISFRVGAGRRARCNAGDGGLRPHVNTNHDLQAKSASGKAPAGFAIEGDALYGDFPDRQSERAGRGVRFLSGRDKNGDGVRRGSLSQTVAGISPREGRWFRLRIRGLAQDGFHVQRDDLFLKVEFFRDGGSNSLDHLQKSIYGQVAQERDDLRDRATNSHLGSGAGAVTTSNSARRSRRWIRFGLRRDLTAGRGGANIRSSALVSSN